MMAVALRKGERSHLIAKGSILHSPRRGTGESLLKTRIARYSSPAVCLRFVEDPSVVDVEAPNQQIVAACYYDVLGATRDDLQAHVFAAARAHRVSCTMAH